MSNPFLHSGQPLFDDDAIHQNIPPNSFDSGGATWMTYQGQSYTTQSISSLISVEVTDVLTDGYYPCQLISPLAGGLAYQMYVPMYLQTTSVLSIGDNVMAQIVGAVNIAGEYILCKQVGAAPSQSFYAVIVSGGSVEECCVSTAYTFAEVSPYVGGLWLTKEDGKTGTAYEVNGNCVENGLIVEIHKTSIDYRFSSCCSPCGTMLPASGVRAGLLITSEMSWCCPTLSLFFPVIVTFEVISGECDDCVVSPLTMNWSSGNIQFEPDDWCKGWTIALQCNSAFLSGDWSDLGLIINDGESIKSYIPLDGGSCDPLNIKFGLIPLPGGCLCNITITT